MPLLRLDANLIGDCASFHDVCAETLGFPGFYGRNMDAWIDCMSWLDSPASRMTTVHVSPPEVLVLCVDGAAVFKQRCPDIFAALVECSAFVNYRRIERGDPAVLALSYYT